MPLSLALVFHFNQHTQAYAEMANRAAYRGLLKVLRAHPQLKFNLHFSGPVLRALNWFDPETLALVKAGLTAGQFELLGGAYAENVLYLAEEWDAAQQINLAREVLHSTLGVKPSVFWNSGRTWRQSLVPLIAGGGYTTPIIEDHILHSAGLADPVPSLTALEGRSLTLIYDDTILRSRFNYAAWFGRRKQLFDYLQQMAARPGSRRFMLAYAEDAEAMGLWGWERGYLPQAAWHHLAALLDEIENSGDYQLRHLSSARARQTLTSLPESAAQSLDHALLDPHAPFHESGYCDWFDFVRRSPEVAYFRRLHDVLRSRLKAVGSTSGQAGWPPLAQPAPKSAEKFYRQAVEIFCHHQYEFGHPGIGGRKYWGWQGARTAFLFARVAEIAKEPRPWHWIEDANGDGSDEQLLCDGRRLAVFTAHGGRLIYWFDLVEGRQWLGNQLAIPEAPYLGGSTKQPKLAPAPNVWLPETDEADLKAWKTLKVKEAPPTRLAARLPAWVFEREPAHLTVYRQKKAARARSARLPWRAQMGSFCEAITLDDGNELAPDDLLDYRLEPEGFCYLIYPAPVGRTPPPVLIEKRVRQTRTGMAVRYDIANRDRTAHRLRLKCSNELNPDYGDVLAGGRAALSFLMFNELYPAVANLRTKRALVLEPSLEWTNLEHAVSLLAWEVTLSFDLPVPPHSARSLELQLNLGRL
jgi:hypothetical protein